MIGIRSAFSIRARGHRPHLEAVYMTAPRSVCRNTKKALPTGGRPYMTAGTRSNSIAIIASQGIAWSVANGGELPLPLWERVGVRGPGPSMHRNPLHPDRM